MEGIRREGGVQWQSITPVTDGTEKQPPSFDPTRIEAPVQVPPPKKKPFLSTLFGFAKKPAVVAVMAGAMALGCTSGAALANDRIPVDPDPVVQLDTEPVVGLDAAQPTNEAYRRAMEELADMRRDGRITPAEYEVARSTLLRAFLLGKEDNLIRDHDGDVDVEALLIGMTTDDAGAKSKGQIVMERLTRRLEHRMQVTARDMANPNTRFIEGAPGYKEISQREVERLVLDALQDMPLEDLPLGSTVAELIGRLPAGSRVTPSMSFREAGDVLGEDGKALLDEKLGPFFEEHAVEAGIVAFGAVTGLRYASPEAARLMDGLSFEVWDASTKDGRAHIEAELAYRDQHILPQLDLTATANTTVGLFDLRGGLESTIAPEADEDILRGRVTVGARTQSDDLWADGSISRYLHRDRTRIDLSAGGQNPSTGLSHATTFTALLGDDAAHGDADGRLMVTFDLSKPIEIGDAEGSFGFFAGGSMDTDGRNEDVRAGLVLHLRW